MKITISAALFFRTLQKKIQIFLILIFSFLSSKSQNIVYSSLYNSSNFVKTIDLTKLVGTTSGDISVTPAGGISYNIPIYTPPGTNGMEPSISLAYNSNSGNGIAGYGWGIAGMSVISRTGKNIYHNGIVSPVTYTNQDAFLLDGVRLNTISGINGGNGTIYALEMENFSKIVSNTNSDFDNPDWFQVTTKDGAIMEFGRSNDSRIMTDFSATYVIYWRLSKIIDVHGNYVEFKYDNTLSDSRLSQVLYTGNGITGLQPYNQLNFFYKLRTDANTSYDANASLKNNYLLEKISIVHTSDAGTTSTVKTYKLNYGFDNISSFLKEIVEFGGLETDLSLNTTIFLYGDQPQNLINNVTSAISGQYDFYPGDFDADGVTDMVAAAKYFDNSVGTILHTQYSLISDLNINGSSVTVMYQKNLPTGTSLNDISKTKYYNFLTGDYDGDGRDDVLQVDATIQTGQSCRRGVEYNRFIGNIAINYTKSFNSSTSVTDYTTQNFIYPSSLGLPYQYVSSKNNFFIPGDFDGNGNQDYILILAKKRDINPCPPKTSGMPNWGDYTFDYKAFITSPSTNEINVEIANFGIGTNPFSIEFYAGTIAEADKINVMDFDGDGKMEIIITKDNATFILRIQRTAPSSGALFGATQVANLSAVITKDTKYFPGDFNGDRKTDLLIRKTNGSWDIFYSTGIAFSVVPFSFNQIVAFSSNQITDKIIIADFNGDGKSDILHGFNIFVNSVPTSAKLSLYYSRGNGPAPFYYEQYNYNNILGPEFIVGDFNGDGRADFFNRINIFTGGAEFVAIKPFGKERLLTKITTGHNITTNIDYKLLTDKSSYPYFYNRTMSLDNAVNKNPFNYVELPFYMVAAFTIPDGIGGNNVTSYQYEDAVLHRAAKGLLGFKKIVAENNISGIRTTTENDINTQFASLFNVKQTAYSTTSNQQLSQTTLATSFTNLSTGSGDKRYFQKIDKIFTADNIYNRATESTNTFDGYGNITLNNKKIGTLTGANVTPMETTNTTAVYSIQNTPVPAKAENVTISNTRTGMPTVSSKTSYTYNTKGLLATEKTFDGQLKSVTKTYGYNTFGNPSSTATSSTGLPTTTINAIYDTKGRYIIQQQTTGGSHSQTNVFTISSIWGLPLSKTTADCITTTNTYDAFGRLNYTLLPDGNSVSISNVWNSSGASLFYVHTNYAGGKPDTKIYFDKFDREWKSETVSINGVAADWHTVLTTFDNRGNVKTKTLPYFTSAETARVTTNNFDAFNRQVSSISDVGTVSNSYSIFTDGSLKTTTTNAALQMSSQTVDATGKTVTAVDNGGQLDFKYDSWGNQTEVKNGSNVFVSNAYDIYGRQTGLTDINAGTSSYTYNAYGQLTNQTDAKGNSYTMLYDGLGRLTSKTGGEGTTTYEYYKDIASICNNNTISKVTGYNGITKEYTFDALKRPLTEKQQIDGVFYTTTFAYTSYSQLAQTTYPSGITVYNSYDANGYLKHTGLNSDPAVSTNRFFSNGQVDGEGNYKSYTLGNGKSTTNTYNKGYPQTTITTAVQNLSYSFQITTGNLLQRNDILKNQQEIFTYDNLNRLATATVNGSQQLAMTYDGNTTNSLGNINTKTGAGYYKYKSDKIHAVAYIMNQPSPGQAAVNPPPSSTMEYLNYDQVLTYTPFLKTASITHGVVKLNLTYGPDYQRIKTDLIYGTTSIDKRYFLGNYEKQVYNGITNEIHYISGGNGLCAIIIKQGGTVTAYTTYTDHIGSITAITSAAGTIIAEQNFDAWGRQREPGNWNVYQTQPYMTRSCPLLEDVNNPCVESPGEPVDGQIEWLYRGFTGHETLPYFNLINMNGRMYDPSIGRMLSPDNYVPAPYSTQGYNRYTYAMNNPLKFVDSDGNFPWLAVAAIAAVSGFVKGIQYSGSGQGGFLDGFWRGALIGGAGAALGVLAPIGILPGLAYGAGTGAALGGISSTLDGKDFWNGALKGALVGGALGGISGGLRADALGANVWTGQRPVEYLYSTQLPGITGSEAAPYTDEYLHKVYNQNFKGTKGMSWISKNYMPNNAIKNPDGSWLIGGKDVVATTQPRVWFHGNSSRILFSRAAFQSKEYLAVTMAHELGHVTHFYLELDKYAKSESDFPTKDFIKTKGHVAIQKMTYNLINKNGWQVSGFNIQFQDLLSLGTASDALYNRISFLEKIIVFPK